MSQYSSWPTDGCSSGACRIALSTPSSLDQGVQFASLTKAFHGGSRRQNRSQRKRMNSRRNRKQRGGSAPFPTSFSDTLPTALRGPADVAALDNAFAQLPQFVGKYSAVGGSRRQRGGALGSASIADSGSLLLPPALEAQAGLGMNSQFQTENTINPNFKASPTGPLASQVEVAQANQIRYMANGGRRGSRKAAKKSRKGRKGSRRGSRKAAKKSRKGRKGGRRGSRKAAKKSRKGRKGSRRH